MGPKTQSGRFLYKSGFIVLSVLLVFWHRQHLVHAEYCLTHAITHHPPKTDPPCSAVSLRQLSYLFRLLISEMHGHTLTKLSTHCSYSLSGPRDIDDIFKVMYTKITFRDTFTAEAYRSTVCSGKSSTLCPHKKWTRNIALSCGANCVSISETV